MTELAGYPAEQFVNASNDVVAVRFDVANDLTDEIGTDWQDQLSDAVEQGRLTIRAADGHYSNREANPTDQFGLITTTGSELTSKVPGVWKLYRGLFRAMVEQSLPTDFAPLVVADDPDKAIEAYAQPTTGTSFKPRMESHVDVNYSAVLAVAMPESPTDGGRLFIANNPDAASVEEVDQDRLVIEHVPGTLLCVVGGRKYPHYTEEVRNPDAKRIAVALNYQVAGNEAAADELLNFVHGR